MNIRLQRAQRRNNAAKAGERVLMATKVRDWAPLRTSPDFDRMDGALLARMVAAGHEARNCLRVLAKTGDNVVGEILRQSDTFYEWDHYPPGDVFDPETHAQYYYHAHPPEERSAGEHGHFHTFLRANGLPPGVAPVAESRLLHQDAPAANSHAPTRKKDHNRTCHLVAIAMDGDGFPIRLFTTNRWVTGDDWYRAGDVVAMLDRFVVDIVRPSWAVNRWITAMVALFQPQIEALLVARDQSVLAWQAANGADHDVFEDRGLEVTSSIDVNIETQIANAERALAAPRR